MQSQICVGQENTAVLRLPLLNLPLLEALPVVISVAVVQIASRICIPAKWTIVTLSDWL